MGHDRVEFRLGGPRRARRKLPAALPKLSLATFIGRHDVMQLVGGVGALEELAEPRALQPGIARKVENDVDPGCQQRQDVRRQRLAEASRVRHVAWNVDHLARKQRRDEVILLQPHGVITGRKLPRKGGLPRGHFSAEEDQRPWSLRHPGKHLIIRYDHEVNGLVRLGQPQDGDLDTLRGRITELEAALRERGDMVSEVQADLAAFRIRYRQEVGLLHEELDDLERRLAEAELGEISQRLEEAGAPADAPADVPSEALPRFTTDAIRRLFRDVAKAIHPDLAPDAPARDRRHALMIEANQAYALGDEQRLRSILQAWENSPEAVNGSDDEAARLRLVRRIAQIEAQLNLYAAELAALRDSSLWKLKAMVDEAAAQNNDLIADMVRRLKRDILVTRNRLEAMLWQS